MKINYKKFFNLIGYSSCLILLFWMMPETYEALDQNYIYIITVIFLSTVTLHFVTGEKGNWLWQSLKEGKFWRGDDGSLLSQSSTKSIPLLPKK